MFYSRFMLFPTFKKTNLVEGGGGSQNLFSSKNNSFSFHDASYAIFNIKKKVLKSSPSLTS